jgi:hypothetical protein
MRGIKVKMNSYLLLILLTLFCVGCQVSGLNHKTSEITAVFAFNPPYTIQTPLPDSPKGYELYSWMDGDTRSYTLITGTDRTKDSAEITAAENIVTVDGWVKVSVQDVEALELLLSQLPGDETILFIGRSGIGPAPDDGLDLSLPSQNVLDSLKEYCTGIGLRLVVVD